MSIIEAFILALVLSVDSLVVSATSALKTKLSYRRGVLLAITFALFQGLFPLVGALVGTVCLKFISAIDHWVAFGLLFMVGVNMLINAFKGEEQKDALDLSRYWVICTLAVATSIDAFVVGISFGLSYTVIQSISTCVIISIVTFVISMIGIYLGKRDIPISEKKATILAGLVLIGLGTQTLLEHLLG